MKVTFTIKNLTDNAYAELAAMSDADRFAKLTKWAFGDMRHCVSQKIGSGQFRDRVELNQIMRRQDVRFNYKIEPRRGYKLATFNIA
ncbi:hypothetical protein XM25_00680 [Devosia sp. H5989]|nr:hypothetical protein XM25_00680 [Devosia sp. H5989]